MTINRQKEKKNMLNQHITNKPDNEKIE